jgi:DNA-binding response OmpR family regulator
MPDLEGPLAGTCLASRHTMSAMRILLIEDHRDIAANIAEYFEAKGDAVRVAADGNTGLDYALAGEYDVIVLDLMLPGIDGLTLCKQLRARAAANANTPILMLTAKDLLTDKVAGFDAGADDYLVKPFSLVELAARLKALTRRATTATSQRVLAVSDLHFNLDTLEATRAGQPVKLNPSTRRILAILMQNSHRVVTREEIELELWGAGAPGADILRAHVHALRNAVDKGFDEKLVHTVHGTGYRIAPQAALG